MSRVVQLNFAETLQIRHSYLAGATEEDPSEVSAVRLKAVCIY